MHLFSTKPIGQLHEADDTANELRRTLDARALVMLGIGAIIGTGIFVLTGTAAANRYSRIRFQPMNHATASPSVA